jgi:uncharacterized membrane protein YkvA (DUF1232 family)
MIPVSPGAKERLSAAAQSLKRNVDLYRAVYADQRTPLSARVLLCAALAYMALPFDLIPDFVPLAGQLDDLIIVPGLILLAMRLVPQEVYQEHHRRIFAQDKAQPWLADGTTGQHDLARRLGRAGHDPAKPPSGGGQPSHRR